MLLPACYEFCAMTAHVMHACIYRETARGFFPGLKACSVIHSMPSAAGKLVWPPGRAIPAAGALAASSAAGALQEAGVLQEFNTRPVLFSHRPQIGSRSAQRYALLPTASERLGREWSHTLEAQIPAKRKSTSRCSKS